LRRRVQIPAEVFAAAFVRIVAPHEAHLVTRLDPASPTFEADLRAHSERIHAEATQAANMRCLEELLMVLPYLCLPLDVDGGRR
jgi:hypothetical protein